jgi:hypothetical protein
MLFIDFEQPNRVRVSGRATITDEPAVVGATPARCSRPVAVDEVFPNCPRYIHRTGRELSSNVPDAEGRRRSPSGSACRVQRGARRRRPRRALTSPAGTSSPSPHGRRRRLLGDDDAAPTTPPPTDGQRRPRHDDHDEHDRPRRPRPRRRRPPLPATRSRSA